MKKQFHLFVLVVAAAAFTFSSCKKNEQNISSPQSVTAIPDISENGTNPDEAVMNDAANARSISTSYIYTETNAAGQNNILCYKQNNDGSLTLKATVASGGAGGGERLGSQGVLAINQNHRWLFACNVGDNTVSSFAIATDGSLTLAHTVKSKGTHPVSLTCHNNLLYVVNQTSANISGYYIGAAGALTAIKNSVRSLSSTAADPGQIAFSPNGDYLYVTERAANKITTFPVDAAGAAGVGSSIASAGVTPFGFAYSRHQYMVVSNAAGDIPNLGTVSSYKGLNTAYLSAVNGAIPTHQAASCWAATTKYGRFAFITNFVSNKISSYYVAPWGAVYLVHSAAAPARGPRDMCLAPDNYYLYVINFNSKTIGGYHRKFLGDLEPIGTTAGIPEFTAGLVAW